MKLNKIILGIAAAGIAAGFAVPSQAAVLDAWQLLINGNTYTNIGRLSLTAGSATVQQEVDGTGNVFAGALFTESTTIYSISYVQNNVVGPTDTGAPTSFAGADQLQITLSGVTGHVTGPSSGGGFAFVFDSGSFLLQDLATSTNFATGSLVGVGGTLNNTSGFSGANGQSVQDVILASLLNGFNIMDSTGTPLDISKILFEAVTNNQVGSGAGDVTSGACGFDPTKTCLTLRINSNGDAFLTTVPEPATLGLLGIGLLGMGFAGRHRAKK